MRPTRSNRARRCAARRLAADESGALTVWMIFWSVAFMLLGGAAVDGAKAWNMRAALQAAADASAHAAALELGAGSAAARARAVEVAGGILPPDRFGDVLKHADIEIGRWDKASRGIVADGAADTVRVTLRRADVNGNPEPTTFLRLAGLLGWDVSARSSARAATGSGGPGDGDPCWTGGLVARGVVDMQSNSILRNICIHGEAGVSINNNNTFDDDVTVSMPSLSLLDIPEGGLTSNPGLAEALAEGSRDPWIVDHVDQMIYSIRDSNPAVWVPNDLFDARDAEPGVVYWVYCLGSGGTLSVRQNTTLEDVVILTNCAIRFKKSVVLINTLIGTTGDRIAEADAAMFAVEDDSTTVMGANELRLGYADGCAAGGGSRLLIDGDFRNPAKLRINGSQIIATGDVEIAAQGSSIEGISIIAGGKIDLTSNNEFGACGVSDFGVPAASTRVSLVE